MKIESVLIYLVIQTLLHTIHFIRLWVYLYFLRFKWFCYNTLKTFILQTKINNTPFLQYYRIIRYLVLSIYYEYRDAFLLLNYSYYFYYLISFDGNCTHHSNRYASLRLFLYYPNAINYVFSWCSRYV